MNCPECGVENKDSDRYCAACGAALHSGEAPGSEAKPAESPSVEQAPPPVAAVPPSAIKEPAPSSKGNGNSKRTWLIVAAVLLLLLCCCCLLIGVVVSLGGNSLKDLNMEDFGSSSLMSLYYLI
jgi:hypothetical protein